MGIKFDVRDTVKNTEKMKPFLKAEWCKCEQAEFLCYPEDDCCSCGVSKHHCHCAHCGAIYQVG